MRSQDLTTGHRLAFRTSCPKSIEAEYDRVKSFQALGDGQLPCAVPSLFFTKDHKRNETS